MTDFKKEDRVRVSSLEGTISSVDFDHHPRARVDFADGQWAWLNRDVLEKLPDPEPEWWPPRPDDVAVVDRGDYTTTIMRSWGQWVTPPGVKWSDDDVLERARKGKVTLVLRNGERQ